MSIRLGQKEIDVRRFIEALRSISQHRKTAEFRFTGNGTNKDFVIPSGWRVKQVFEDGLKVREGVGDDYTVLHVGFSKVTFAVAPINLAYVDIVAEEIREWRS